MPQGPSGGDFAWVLASIFVTRFVHRRIALSAIAQDKGKHPECQSALASEFAHIGCGTVTACPFLLHCAPHSHASCHDDLPCLACLDCLALSALPAYPAVPTSSSLPALPSFPALVCRACLTCLACLACLACLFYLACLAWLACLACFAFLALPCLPGL